MLMRILFSSLTLMVLLCLSSFPQIPMENVLSRIALQSQGDMRGLVDVVGFPQRAEQMDFIGKTCEDLEKEAIKRNQEQS